MSFSFNGIGSKADVLASLEAAEISTHDSSFNAFGVELRDLMVKFFKAETVEGGPGHEYRYVVKASGHSGSSSPLSVQLTIEPLWVAVPNSGPSNG